MAKFFGAIGFEQTTEYDPENHPGVYKENIVAKNYYGDVIRDTRSLEKARESLNDNISISNQISILADPYANNNFHSMRWVEYMGSKWKITSVQVQFPRLILTIGGLYNAH